jgi:DNA-directed RNA polymerase subunit RPC12/RpoP
MGIMSLSSSLLVLAALLPAQQPPRELYQDFRDRRPLSSALTLFGRDVEDVVKREKEGLRVTLPKDETQTWGWGVAADFTLSGDFEITGAYEWLTVEQPLKAGKKVGVSLQVAPNEQRPKWAQVGRYLRPQGGVHAVEYWDKAIPNSYAAPGRPTEARTGQLRLVREGSMMSYYAKEGSENEFQKIYEREFGKDDLAFVRFVAANNTNPTTVDVRLLDLRIRSDSVPVTADQVSLSAASGETETPSKNGLTGMWLLGSALVLAMVMVLGLWVYARQSRRDAPQPAETAAAVPPVSFLCSTCGKRLKAKVELAGKKVKCSQCGKAALVPGTEADEASRTSL